jgi:hypothetical protein
MSKAAHRSGIVGACLSFYVLFVTYLQPCRAIHEDHIIRDTQIPPFPRLSFEWQSLSNATLGLQARELTQRQYCDSGYGYCSRTDPDPLLSTNSSNSKQSTVDAVHQITGAAYMAVFHRVVDAALPGEYVTLDRSVVTTAVCRVELHAVDVVTVFTALLTGSAAEVIIQGAPLRTDSVAGTGGIATPATSAFCGRGFLAVVQAASAKDMMVDIISAQYQGKRST